MVWSLLSSRRYGAQGCQCPIEDFCANCRLLTTRICVRSHTLPVFCKLPSLGKCARAYGFRSPIALSRRFPLDCLSIGGLYTSQPLNPWTPASGFTYTAIQRRVQGYPGCIRNSPLAAFLEIHYPRRQAIPHQPSGSLVYRTVLIHSLLWFSHSRGVLRARAPP